MISLDNFSAIKKHDHSGMASVIAAFPDQCREAVKIGLHAKIPASYKTKYRNIVCAGMGGSAIGADLARSYIADESLTPFFVNRNYTLPAFVSKDTLVIASSYSGNTEETIAAFRDAIGKGARIIVITTGGKLRDLALKRSIPVIQIPSGIQPRAAIGYSFFTLILTLSRLGIIGNKTAEIAEAIKCMADLGKASLYPDVFGTKNIAKNIAKSIYLKIPVIYSNADHMDAVCMRWRGQLAENAKTIASSGLFPEMVHNEIVGWEHPAKALKDLVVIMLRDRDDNIRVAKKMDIVRREIAGLGVKVVEVKSRGKGLLARMFSLVYIGDYVSLYLAALNGCDPTPVDRIVRLKREMERFGKAGTR